MSISYGIPIRPAGDPWVRMVEEAFTIGAALIQPGQYLVDILPIMRYIPSWVPGAKFQREAKEWRATIKSSMIKPFDAATQAMVRRDFISPLDRVFQRVFSSQLGGTAKPSFVSASLAQLDENSSDYAHRVQVVKETASMVYIGMYSLPFVPCALLVLIISYQRPLRQLLHVL